MKNPFLIILLASSMHLFGAETQSNPQSFKEAISAALREQDRSAFYKLVDFGGLNSDWIENNKMLIEVYFNETKSHLGFSGSIIGGAAAMPQPMPTQQYNHPIAGAYLIHFGPDTAMHIPLCQIDGNWRVACIMLKKETEQGAAANP